MSLVLPTQPWADRLWAQHVAHAPETQDVLDAGTARQPQFGGFAADVHAALYLRHAPDPLAEAPAWASNLLQTAQGLAEWQPLHARCQASGFAAGVATEQLLWALLDQVPQGEAQDDDAPQAPGQPGAGDEDAAAAQRRQIRQALRQAGRSVDEAQEAVEGLTTVCGLQAGTGTGRQETAHDLDEVRRLWALLRGNPALRTLAALAGRLARLGQAQRTRTVTASTGVITGIEIGGDLPRVLPSELAGLRSANRLCKLATLGKLMERRALQYRVQAPVPHGRGPVIVLLDSSGSMQGEAEQWAKAVALALLQTCLEQRRAWHLATFTTEIVQELAVPAGAEASIAPVLNVLRLTADGGTAFDPPLQRALTLVETAALRHADIVLITDGQAAVSAEVAAAVQATQQAQGTALYVIGLGSAITPDHPLRPLATQLYHLSGAPEAESGAIAPLLALVAQPAA